MTIYVGDTLTATAATVAGDPTPSRTWQWLRDGTAISGATSSAYTVQGADEGAVLSVQQTETNFLGSASATSAETATVFSPAALFESSELGAWYDPSDLSTMWTDTGATTQASVGDEVARIDDKSGNGNHATQATFAARPILRQTGGGLYYLEFDGTDDHYITSTGVLGGSSTVFSLVSAATYDAVNGASRPFSLGSSLNGTAGSSNSEVFSPAGDASLRFDGNSASGSGSISVGVPTVRLSTRNEDSVVDRINGTENINTTVVISPTIDEICLANGTTIETETNFYGGIVVDRVLTGQEISDTETHLAAKSGVTL